MGNCVGVCQDGAGRRARVRIDDAIHDDTLAPRHGGRVASRARISVIQRATSLGSNTDACRRSRGDRLTAARAFEHTGDAAGLRKVPDVGGRSASRGAERCCVREEASQGGGGAGRTRHGPTGGPTRPRTQRGSCVSRCQINSWGGTRTPDPGIMSAVL